ncbi:MAG: hypothetical protein WAT66_12675 [Actinomycetota bacterium]
MTTRRFAMLIMTVGLLAAVALGVTPLSYRSPEGVQKDVGFVESQVVSCGRAFKLDYESAPPGSSDECTPEVVGRWILIIISIGGAGLLAAGALVIPKVLRRNPKQHVRV